VFRFEGQVAVFDSQQGPCFRCLFPFPPPPELVQDCSQAGVLGVLTGVVGTLQANEVVKLILRRGKPLIGRTLLYDAMAGTVRLWETKKDPECPVCGANPSITSLVDYEAFCNGPRAPSMAAGDSPAITVEELKSRFENDRSIDLLDVREHSERVICKLGGKHIPLGELAHRMTELDQSRELVVYCHHGIRSREAVMMLQRSGFHKAMNLAGGIDAWAARIDHSMARY
jgi:adenylyltransferase/sulfurtransferase